MDLAILQRFVALAIVAVAASIMSSMLVRWSIGLAYRRQLMAEVNHRSSHKVPTPRVGGIGLVAGLLAGCLLAMLLLTAPFLGWHDPALRAEDQFHRLMLMFFAVMAAFFLGFWDDQSDPPALAKLVGQLGLAFLPPVFGFRIVEVFLPGLMEAPYVLNPIMSIILSGSLLLAMMNAVNFMDGINGLAGRYGQIVALAAIGMFAPSPVMVGLLVPAAALLGAAQGFLKHNLGVAKTFMGDCGSQPLGLFCGLMTLEAAQASSHGFVLLLCMLAAQSIFLFDVGYTITKRYLEGKNILKAHREHLYQRFLIACSEEHDRTLQLVVSALGLCALGAVTSGLLFRMMPFSPVYYLPLFVAPLINIVYMMLVLRAEKVRSGAGQ